MSTFLKSRRVVKDTYVIFVSPFLLTLLLSRLLLININTFTSKFLFPNLNIVSRFPFIKSLHWWILYFPDV